MTKTSQERARRARNPTATREAILAAARVCFARNSYEQVGVRDIAATAGVNPALVIRYFGSKEGLFAETVSGTLSLEGLLHGERAQLGERLARYVLRKDEASGELDPLRVLLRSLTNEYASGLLRELLERQFTDPLARWLGGDHALLRAGMIAASLTGLAVTRALIRMEPLASAETERLVALAAPVLQTYVDGQAPSDTLTAPSPPGTTRPPRP